MVLVQASTQVTSAVSAMDVPRRTRALQRPPSMVAVPPALMVSGVPAYSNLSDGVQRRSPGPPWRRCPAVVFRRDVVVHAT
ncbi:hypothetical protein [Streptomyces sp. B21-083]|uniref:hypothetical protein n=1 Tax=Streptomyces sp. B21-083 TaxID=3039410 RepID=UPI002FF42D43